MSRLNAVPINETELGQRAFFVRENDLDSAESSLVKTVRIWLVRARHFELPVKLSDLLDLEHGEVKEWPVGSVRLLRRVLTR
jgi:hypothetical protein